ncbi:virion structural protein [Pseudomonas phage AAT-1]|uniref:Virion structural protein n=1 Tax=Pseudomonas phage AAT-1 TaxID=1775248 RepID=A0A125SA56_9CAUD|nr:virion structural protein [Pseudomonas phage AAT-1]AME18052.1 virion structural protein [Pseudomonas phage AAT-1]
MAVITVYGLQNYNVWRQKNPPEIAPGYDEIDFVDGSVPPDRPVMLAPGFGFCTITDNTPIDLEPHEVLTSYRQQSFLDDYYFRVHVNPGVIELGNLLSTQTRNVEVWSAYFEPRLLSSISQVGTDGITLTQPALPPTSFAALEARIYTLNISTNGAPVINALYTFNFPGDSPTLTVTGRRVVVWPFVPQTEHRETLEWFTDILPSFGAEQRIALRTAPRQSFNHEFQLDEYQYSRAKAIATQWAHRVYGLPVWSELTRLGPVPMGTTELMFDTSNADYRSDDIVIVWESDEHFVAAECTDVLADRVVLKLPLEQSYQNAYVAPLRFARTFEGMQFRRRAHDVVTASATFQVTANKDLGASVGLPQYRGKDVLTDRTILVGDLVERISRSIDEFDNGSGPIAVDIKNGWVNYARAITFDTLDRAARWSARKWVHSRRGRQKAFWLPSWNPDLVILDDVGPTGASLTVRPIGYPLYYGIKDVMIELNDGTRIFSRVLGAAVDVNGNEELSLEAPVGTGFAAADVALACFMSHVRFNSDRVEISHSYAGRATASVPVTETPEA